MDTIKFDCDTELLRQIRDKDGFTVSFESHETVTLCEFFATYGFVVIRNVLTPEECRATIDEIWNDVNIHKGPFFDGILDPSNPSTLETPNLPRLAHLGIIGNLPCISRQAWENRQNPKMYQAAEALMGRSDLWINFDRYGMMRPTKNIRMVKKKRAKEEDEEEVQIVDRPDWQTKSGWLHWDMNPWTFQQSVMGFSNKGDWERSKFERFPKGHRLDDEEKQELEREYGGVKLQGLLALHDSRVEDGGFCTVPGFGSEFMQWALDHQDLFETNYRVGNFVHVPKDDPMRNRVIKVPMRAGSILFWSLKQPHANYPVNSDQFRYVQYMSPVPAVASRYEREIPANVVISPKLQFEPTQLGRRLFGLEPWTGYPCSIL